MLAILAVLCPPLAVLATGTYSGAAANFGLTLLLYVPGMMHALSVVERHTIQRRYDAVMNALEQRRAR
jgi:uncharacterized membrane protein YqaE (UPF0057 family)